MRRILAIVALSVLASANLAITATNAESETPSPAKVHDLDGNLLDQTTVGRQVILSKTFENEKNVSQPYVAIFEVRDPDGLTVYLTWQTGIMAAGGQANVGASWIAEGAGEHHIRTFLLSSLTSPEALDIIWESSIVVQDTGA
jgi:hypothetical protein